MGKYILNCVCDVNEAFIYGLNFREGWEKLGLYEYYKVKNAARKEKEEEIEKGIRERSRSPSPIIIEIPRMNKLNKRRYR